MNLFNAAYDILADHGEPMPVMSIWEQIQKRGLYSGKGKTPWQTLTANIIWHCKGVHTSRKFDPIVFYRSGPSTYGLLEWLSSDELKSLEENEKVEAEIENSRTLNADLLDTKLFLEKEWHQWLYNNLKHNGLEALGFGILDLYDPKKQTDKNMGKYNTSVIGEIDLLLKDDTNQIIVIELKRRGIDETIGQICRYVGWVEENLAKKNQKVFGIILAQTIDEKLKYAIKPIKDHIYYQQLILKVEFGESSK
ncbi:MAG: endonuclease NucS [Spirochaetia bacterium]|nr:endonuclease NucS [Spirochaetia bacterium]